MAVFRVVAALMLVALVIADVLPLFHSSGDSP
jgi:hypothetical protein